MNNLNKISFDIIGCAYKVHRELGPGLLESTYEACLCYELIKKNYSVERQKELPVIYEGVYINTGYRIDLLVNDLIIVELKAVQSMMPVFEAQLLTYLKLSKKNLGLLINFNVCNLQNGIIRRIL